MKRSIIYFAAFLPCSSLMAAPVINLYQDDLTLNTSAELVHLTGGTESFHSFYSGHLFNNNVSVEAIDAKYYLVDEDDIRSVRAIASGDVTSYPGAYELDALSEAYPSGGGAVGSIQTVSSVYASATLDWLFIVEGGNVEFSAHMYNGLYDGYLGLYDITDDSYAIEFSGPNYEFSDSVDLLDGHSYSLYISTVDASFDDDDNDVYFLVDASIVRVSEPSLVTLMMLGLSVLFLLRKEQPAV